ncbi:COG1361 S-layer family protein [Natronomonas sp. EA1]|uniref:COG1361 S-layer family protein n=1 Tax=Natronomonas sp. EA1 TaxID=3421655 RepID=UPI003EB9C92A
MRRGVALTLVLLLVGSLLAPMTVGAIVEGDPVISLSASDNRVVAGETTTVGVTVMNTGDVENGGSVPGSERQVTTARGLTLSMSSGNAPVSVRTGTVAVGSVPEGAVGPLQFQLVVDEDADPGKYRVPVEVSYTHTRTISEQGSRAFTDREVTETKYVTVIVEEAPRFEVVSAETDAAAGGSGAVDLTLRNVGSATAHDAQVSLASRTGSLTFGQSGSAETFVGEWAPGETRTVSATASVAAQTATRSLPLTATVSFDRPDGIAGTDSVQFGVTPEAENRVTVTDVSSAVAVGDSGTVTVTLENAAGQDLEDATVTLASQNGALTFGGSPTATVFVGEWAAGESRDLTVEAAFARGAEPRSYAVEATTSYDYEGSTVETSPSRFGVTPAGEQAFSLSNTASTLRVGAEGTLSGTVTNDGPGPAENAVVVLQPTAANVNAVETEYALGDLQSGESAEFTFDVEISDNARDGPRQFSYVVRYANDDTTKTSDQLYDRQTVAPERPVFAVETRNATLSPGGSARFVVSVTNQGDEPVSDISAKLFADAPVSTSDDEAFIDALEPGETREVVFQLSVAGSAIEKTYPVSVDFQYEEADGDTKLSDTYRLPVTVQASGGGGGLLSFAPAGLAALGLALGGVVIRFR